MNRLIDIWSNTDIPASYRDTPLGDLLRYHDLRAPMPARAEKPELLIGMCMDSRKHLRIPDNYAFILRTGGANLRQSEFRVSYAIGVGGVRFIAVIGHTNCGMSGLAARREQFVKGLVEVGWDRPEAEEQFDTSLPTHEVGAEIDFVVSEARRLRALYPKVRVAPMIYRVEDDRICAVQESGGV